MVLSMEKRSKIAVLIPCYNEAKTIEKVVKDYKKALPEGSESKLNTFSNGCSSVFRIL